VLPSEHGGWAFLGEPLLLGLVVAPSAAGIALAFAALAGFLARQPLKLAAGDRRKGRRYPRTVAAERALGVLGAAGLVALAAAAWLAPARLAAAGLALAPVVALGATALAFDLGRRSREAAAESVAALALAGMASVIALAGGAPAPVALTLWGALGVRVVSTIPFVRARLRLDRGEPAGIGGALAGQVLAMALAVALVLAARASWPLALGAGLLAARAAWGLSPWRPRLRVALLGVTEIAWGLVMVTLSAIAVRGLR
jgi:hypothetical protein